MLPNTVNEHHKHRAPPIDVISLFSTKYIQPFFIEKKNYTDLTNNYTEEQWKGGLK